MSLIDDASGTPLSAAGFVVKVVPGSELRQAGSHTALLQRQGELTADIFLKKVTASLVANRAWNDQRRVLLYIRNELRFYADFADGLRNRVGIPKVVHLHGLNLDDLEEHEEPPPASVLDRCGGHMLLESFADPLRFEQTSPITRDQARRVLDAAASLHAVAWEEASLLTRAAERLQRHGGSYALAARNPRELHDLPASWDRFVTAFAAEAPAGFFERAEIASLGTRLQSAAHWISEQLSPSPHDRYATLVHDLDGGGEEALVDGYLASLAAARGATAAPYPREVAFRHFRLATCDYGRFVMGRFWGAATPERFAASAMNANVVLANRHLPSALRFIERISAHLAGFEQEIAAAAESNTCGPQVHTGCRAAESLTA